LWEWRYSSIDGVEWSTSWPGHSTSRESLHYILKVGWAAELVWILPGIEKIILPPGTEPYFCSFPSFGLVTILTHPVPCPKSCIIFLP